VSVTILPAVEEAPEPLTAEDLAKLDTWLDRAYNNVASGAAWTRVNQPGEMAVVLKAIKLARYQSPPEVEPSPRFPRSNTFPRNLDKEH
jgi:hypothetical protein